MLGVFVGIFGGIFLVYSFSKVTYNVGRLAVGKATGKWDAWETERKEQEAAAQLLFNQAIEAKAKALFDAEQARKASAERLQVLRDKNPEIAELVDLQLKQQQQGCSSPGSSQRSRL